MTEADVAILEFFYELGDVDDDRVVLPPGTVYENLVEQLGVLQKSKSTISRRMKKLSEEDLLEKIPDTRGTYYRITDVGVDYLEGNVDADDLEEPEN
ncbi:hypothetical protein SAMN06269185_1046 [Natronoarchaeum philippinense]|uniref:Uncharacterized protein n=1 Tax=Natronoarchaeum philippinense TaxID=558529 RepID=A0A285NDU7_NATPI|nr:winged helix-turn-helix domain-containing protein [Natronoarchaeum philippinense]SNZ06096.1 hypothetical protein SAMN06269185_1046 [Natronoarchaeum philippinense]